ncbi:DUF5317 family protein [Actinoplanes sp. NPDC051861]|uniref:DUF5317 family protein n=1 Tax=Actinoplanes sp. NPDC051861 TaxID=3155170 RepID=UPI003422818C
MPYALVALFSVPVLAGVASGYALSGRLAGLAALRPRALWLLWVAVAAQICQRWSPAGIPMLAIVFALVLVWLMVNLRQREPVLRVAGAAIALGVLLNGAAILANGRMPYSPTAAAAAGASTPRETPKNVPAGPDSRLTLLADVVPVPALRAVISPGDILIGTGVALAIAGAMRSARRRRSPSEPVEGGEPVEH